MHFWCGSHPGCGTLLWQPEETVLIRFPCNGLFDDCAWEGLQGQDRRQDEHNGRRGQGQPEEGGAAGPGLFPPEAKEELLTIRHGDEKKKGVQGDPRLML